MSTDKKRIRLTKRNLKRITLILALVLVLGLAIGNTIAFLYASTEKVSNKFIPGKVTGEITETFDDVHKKTATVANTGNVTAYVRAAVVGVELNANKEIIGTYDVSGYIDTDKWQLLDGYYYYKGTVAPGESTPNIIKADGDGIPLQVTTGTAPDTVTRYYQVTIVAELIQAEGKTQAGVDAVTDAWGVSYGGGSWSAGN